MYKKIIDRYLDTKDIKEVIKIKRRIKLWIVIVLILLISYFIFLIALTK